MGRLESTRGNGRHETEAEYKKLCEEVAYRIYQRRELEAEYGEEPAIRDYYKQISEKGAQNLDYQIAEQWIQSPTRDIIIDEFDKRIKTLQVRQRQANQIEKKM